MTTAVLSYPDRGVTALDEPVGPGLRIGTQEREDAIETLGSHFSFGRLLMDEYEQRVSTVLAAQTQADVHPLFDDLPSPHPSFMSPDPEPAPAVSPPSRPAPPERPVGRSDKSRIAAGLLQLMFPFGTGRFYTGHTRTAFTQLALVFVGVGVIWSLVDGIQLLVSGGSDPDGRPLVFVA